MRSADLWRMLESLDFAMIRLFQNIVNISDVSNYRWAQIFCALGGGCSLSALMWWMQVAIFPVFKMLFFSFWTLIYLHLMAQFQHMDKPPSTHFGNSFQSNELVMLMRLILMLFMLYNLSPFIFGMWHHWSRYNLVFFISFVLSIPVALYFAACDPPPSKGRRIRTKDN